MSTYFHRWMELSGTEKTYEWIRNLVVYEQFLNCCNRNLDVFLKEKRLEAIDDLADSANGFFEAQGLKNFGRMTYQQQQLAGKENTPELSMLRITKQVPRRCFLCDGVCHLATTVALTLNTPNLNQFAMSAIGEGTGLSPVALSFKI